MRVNLVDQVAGTLNLVAFPVAPVRPLPGVDLADGPLGAYLDLARVVGH